jgi:hypothetical protein
MIKMRKFIAIILLVLTSFKLFGAAASDTNLVAGFKLSQGSNFVHKIPFATTNISGVSVIIWTNNLPFLVPGTLISAGSNIVIATQGGTNFIHALTDTNIVLIITEGGQFWGTNTGISPALSGITNKYAGVGLPVIINSSLYISTNVLINHASGDAFFSGDVRTEYSFYGAHAYIDAGFYGSAAFGGLAFPYSTNHWQIVQTNVPNMYSEPAFLIDTNNTVYIGTNFIVKGTNATLTGFAGNGNGVTNVQFHNTVYPLGTFASVTNAIYATNKYYDLIVNSGNVAITNVVGGKLGELMMGGIRVSNAAATVMTQFVTAPTITAVLDRTTNALIIPAGKCGITSFYIWGQHRTNYITGLEQ